MSKRLKPEWHDKVPEPKERTVVIGKDTDHDVSGKHGHRGFLPAGTGVCCVNGQSMTDHEELVNFR